MARVADCVICRMNDPNDELYVDVLAENKLWLVYHWKPEKAPLPGYLMFHSQRHVQGPADFTDEEAANFTFAIRHVSRILREVTGADRIYTIAIGETGPHLHAHLIPRYSDARLKAMGIEPKMGTAMGVFDLFRAVSGGQHPPTDVAQVRRVCAEVKKRLAASPIPVISTGAKL